MKEPEWFTLKKKNSRKKHKYQVFYTSHLLIDPNNENSGIIHFCTIKEKITINKKEVFLLHRGISVRNPDDDIEMTHTLKRCRKRAENSMLNRCNNRLVNRPEVLHLLKFVLLERSIYKCQYDITNSSLTKLEKEIIFPEERNE